jgi:hypothetical protein
MAVADTELRLTVRCAWCGRIISRGKPTPIPAISHGLCRNCFVRERLAWEEVQKGRRPSA